MNEINDIKSDLIAWESSHYDDTILKELQQKSTPLLRTKLWQLKRLDKDNSKYMYFAPTTLFMFKKAVAHELRKRAWYWPIIVKIIPLFNWYSLTFREQYFFETKFGFKAEDSFLKKKWWHQDLADIIVLFKSFCKKHWQILLPVSAVLFVGIMAAIVALFIHFDSKSERKSAQENNRAKHNMQEKVKK
jgi:hypothetical protein